MAKILVIDDSPMQLKLLRKMLEKNNHAVCEAESGEMGIQAAQQESPDLIMLDVVMPDLNGFEVTRKIRRNPLTKNIPIVLVSSKAQEADKKWGFRQGANAYLVKPYNKTELFTVIAEFLEQPRASANN